MKYFLALCLIFGLNANEVLWSGRLVSLVEEDGHAAIALNREAPLDDLTDEEKIELERTVGKMQTVFQKVYGFGDFTRWMPLEGKRLTSYLIPSGEYSAPDEINFDLKIRAMLFMLKDRKELLAPIKEEKIRAIQTAAAEILPFPQPDIVLQECSFTCSKIVQGLSHAMRELGQNPEHIEEPPPFKSSFTPRCNVFCNEKILAKQHVFESSFNHLLYNYRPYVDCHLMIVPRQHITTLSESSDEEILDRFAIIGKTNKIARTQLGCPKVGIITRMGWRGGQTQSHVHDHIIGYDPAKEQSWIGNWIQELMGNPKKVDQAEWEKVRAYWQINFS